MPWIQRLLVLMVLGLSGCTAFVARQIERPGHDNHDQLAYFRQLLRRAGFQFDALNTQQDVRLAYWYGLPRAYAIKSDIHEQRTGDRFNLTFTFGFDDGVDPVHAALLPVHGSVILLHPWGMEGAALTNWALLFASNGYVVVAPDLRSHGASSMAPVGYGPREAGDIVELVQQLRAARRLPPPLYLFGVSYGGTVALFAAPNVSGVRGVVALEPYANAAAVIRRAPSSGLFGYRWLASWLRPHEVDQAILRADRKLDIDLENIDPTAAVSKASSCTLILRGSEDVLTSGKALRTLAQASVWASYVSVSDEGHMSLPLRTDRLFAQVLDWMHTVPMDEIQPCPAFARSPSATGIAVAAPH